MLEILTNGEDPQDMKRTWISIRIDQDVEKRLSERGKFKQSYNDVISLLLDEIDNIKKQDKKR